jgi:hypothetical protein
VHLLAATVRRFGGSFADSRIVVTVSRDREPTDLASELPWSRQYPVEWRWMDRDLYAAYDFYGTALQRFTYGFRSPFVLMLDADTLCAGPLDDLVALTGERIGGVIAHVSPMGVDIDHFGGKTLSPEEMWDEFYRAAGLPPHPLVCEHTGWGFMDPEPSRRWCPPYFNLGVLAAPSDVMERLGAVIFDELATVNRHVETFFRCQLALMLAIARTSTPWVELPMRFNFPNVHGFVERYPADAKDVRILHYMRDDQVDRNRDFITPSDVDALLARTGLSPVNALLQERVAAVRTELTQALTGHAA